MDNVTSLSNRDKRDSLMRFHAARCRETRNREAGYQSTAFPRGAVVRARRGLCETFIPL